MYNSESQTDYCGNKTKDGLRRGGVRRGLKKRGKGMKGHVNNLGIVTLIVEVLTKINPTESLIFAKRSTCTKRNYSESSGNSLFYYEQQTNES